MQIVLRDYQIAAFSEAKDRIREGAKSVLIVAPTGAGKTVLASALMEKAQKKGSRSTFVVDRLSLIDQTAAMFSKYGLEHGVIQADHPNWAPELLTQVCSVQTLAKRIWPVSVLDVFDEAHILHKAHKARLEQQKSVVIGLTATPFTKGLKKYFDAVVNVTTTRQLIEDGWLAPYRIFSCTEPDMTGVKVLSTGEWEGKETSKRALRVVGDVVKEYLKHGENRKFICSAVDTAHVEELARQFLAAGINVATYTYKDNIADRSDVVMEFRKPQSTIRGLITVTAASRGFDVPDVSCIIMARPLRKSMAEHIQLFGRGLRPSEGKKDCLVLDHCIATGQRVLTDRGLVPIERITLAHRLWDGHEFVSHGGVVSRGRKGLIRYAGLTATPDHPVKTAAGWRTLGYCAEQQASVITTGVGGTALRERDGHITRGDLAGGAGAALHACALRVRHLWLSLNHFVEQFAWRAYQWVQAMQPAAAISNVAVRAGSEHAAPLHEGNRQQVEGLRRAGDRVPFRLADHLRTVDPRQPRDSAECGGSASRSDQQQRPLRAGQYQVGDARAERRQHSPLQVGAIDASVQAGASSSSLCRRYAERLVGSWALVRGNRRAMGCAVEEAEGEVWDVLDCGPRNSFTCEGLLVHNSGNAARFYLDTEAFFDQGLEALDEHKAKERKKANEKEPTFIKCPECGHLHTPRPACPECGYEYPKRRSVAHVPGTLKELIAGGYQRELSRSVWPMICWYAKQRRPNDDAAAKKMALAIYKQVCGDWPTRRFETTIPVPVNKDVMGLIQYQNIRWARGRGSNTRGGGT